MKKYIDLVGLVSGILLLGLGTYAVWDLAVGAPERLGSYDMLVRGFRGTLPPPPRLAARSWAKGCSAGFCRSWLSSSGARSARPPDAI